ncbi:MAG: aminotransferase class I/II-fold pyridoxal phosphate-dependent enzyme [Bacillota bacterium]|uniref:aminotransferase class I/II-fold pyridoxal phosphate-dependent enzyme n=1 Tax=Desulforudis sp. DRI-14 TaxID=3459793 RepID=UPI003470D1AA
MDQSRAPIYEALVGHRRRRYAGFHVPAHAGGRGASRALRREGGCLLSLDLTELPGLDDLSCPTGPIARAQELAAELYGADRTFFLVNGSTAGIQAMFMACLRAGDKVLLPRHVHRSAVAGLVLTGADPVYLPAGFDEWGLPVPPGEETIAACLERHQDLRAVFLVHPAYCGRSGLTKGVVDLVHSRGLPLLVDEAHGALLPFHPGLPRPSLEQGADACAMSLHKMGGALTQASMLHVRDGLVDEERLARAVRLLQTSSPSYLLLMSLDLARRELAVRGASLVRRAVGVGARLRDGLRAIPGVEVRESPPGGSDPLKVFFSLRARGMDGYLLSSVLERRYRVNVELATAAGVLAVVGPGTGLPEVRALLRAVRELAGRKWKGIACDVRPPLPPRRMTPREAWAAPWKTVRVENAVGEVAAETLCVSPPGIPLLIQGEEVTPEMVEYMLELQKLKRPFPGDEGTLSTIKVVDGG